MKHRDIVLRSYDEVLDHLSTLMIVLADDARQGHDRKVIDAILERHTTALNVWRLVRLEKAKYQLMMPS